MKEFVITIRETLVDDFIVEAETAREAMEIAREKYYKCEFVLEPGNLIAKKMAVSLPRDEAVGWTEF